jgi:hypothetical protein
MVGRPLTARIAFASCLLVGLSPFGAGTGTCVYIW